MGQPNVPWKGTSQCAPGMGLVYELCKWNKPKCSVNGTIQCALEMGLANVPGNGTSQCALGMGLANPPWEWD